MATLTEDPGKRGKTYRIGFLNADRQRKTVRIGAMPKKKAETIRSHVDQLEACLFDGSAPPPATAAWLASVGDVLRKRMEKAGLVEVKAAAAPESTMPTLGELVAMYQTRPKFKKLKPNSVKNEILYAGCLLRHFRASMPIDKVTEADGEDYYEHLQLPLDQGGMDYSESTAMAAIGAAHRLYRFAIKSRLIDRSPFDDVPRGNAHRGNNAYLTTADSLAVLGKLPSTEWRLLFGLARWGGLRTPSEPRGLRWCDVDWENKRFLVHSPKTERHHGHETRWVPIFPELMPLFEARFDEAAEGEELVIPRLSKKVSHVSTIKYAARLAGVDQWPRIFHSLRSTRQTELQQTYPGYVVCAWLGNSEIIARKHYLQVTDQHFEQAAQKAAQTASADVRHGETTVPPHIGETLDCRNVSSVGGA